MVGGFRKVQELVKRPCAAREMMRIDMKQWNGGENKTQRYLEKNLTGQLDAEDEAGDEDDFKNSSLGDWIGGKDIRSEIGHTGKTGSWSYFPPPSPPPAE